MSRLFKRGKQLIIGGKTFPDLDMDFDVKFGDEDEPDVSMVTVYNLSPDSVAHIKPGQRLTLNAGYDGNLGNILSGHISDIQQGKDSVDHSYKVMVTPENLTTLTKTVNKTYSPGVTAMQIVTELLRESGIESGNITLENNITYENGKIISGSLAKALQDIAKETNSFYFNRNGIIFIVANRYELDTGFLLRPDTGLIGSPEVIDIDGQVGYKITCLLNPLFVLGSVFRLESKMVSGLFRVQNGSHSGDFITTVNCLPTTEVSRYVPPVKLTNVSGGNTNKDKIWNFLQNQGFSRGATAGVMGNIEQESGYDPNSENSIGAFGIFQWLGDRREALEIYASQKGQAYNDLMLQLDFFMYEVTIGGESSSFDDYGGINGFKQISDPIQACDIFEACFERSGGDAMENRRRYAQDVYDWNGQSSTASGATGGDGNFPAGAFQCACGCGLDCVPELKNKMNQVWDNVGGGITITSAARCPYQNGIDGGVSDSLHLTGEACDCYISGASVDYLYNQAQAVGLGTYRYYSSGFVHCQTYPADVIWD